MQMQPLWGAIDEAKVFTHSYTWKIDENVIITWGILITQPGTP